MKQAGTTFFSGRRALLLSAYDAASHRLWRESLVQMFPDIHWTVLHLPPRYFQWRIRGNSLSWAFNHRHSLTDNHDFLVATSMTDLSALRGFVPALGQLPTAVYFHENQFAYPASGREFDSVEPRILNLYTALCADTLLFNSGWNRSSFLEGVAGLLHKLPDQVPQGLLDRLANSSVLPVPLSDDLFGSGVRTGRQQEADVLDLVWNHRWEYDKGPELLLAVVQQLVNTGIRFRLHLLGQQFRQRPAEFDILLALLDSHYRLSGISPGHVGHVPERESYLGLLSNADVVLSTARHDFQGLALLEGIACGCSPVAPDSLSYPEYLSADCLYRYGEPVDRTAASICRRLSELSALKAAGEALPVPDISGFSASRLREGYAAVWHSLLTRQQEKQQKILV